MNDDPEALRRIKSVLFDYKHDKLIDAVVADLVDIVPWVGGISNGERTRRARVAGDDKAFKLQLIDTIAGSVPYIGTILDIITPTNTIIFLNEKADLKLPLPVEDIANILKNANNWIRKQ